LYSFNPNEVNTVKEKVERYVTIRHGQQKFKEDLLKSYNYKCAVTGCNVIEVLQASHIVPYNGKETNHIQNGIILRVDIHNLFDSGLITIDPDTYKVIVSNKLRSSLYYEYNGKKILLPEDTINYPSREALRYRMKDFI
jgi:predicted restriction endonuclease